MPSRGASRPTSRTCWAAAPWPCPTLFRQPRPDSYARRLLHRDPLGRYTAIVMTWGPGQGTPVHDHGGLWCVEGVVEGQIAVTQYDVTPDRSGEFAIAARRHAWWPASAPPAA